MGYERGGRDRAPDDYRYRQGGQDRFQSRSSYEGGNRYRDQDDDDRGFFARAGDEVRSWFGDEDSARRREQESAQDDRDNDYRGRFQGRQGSQSFGRDDYRSQDYGRRPTSRQGREQNWDSGNLGQGQSRRETAYEQSRPGSSTYGGGGSEDHGYGEWRRRQIEQLDRDYDEYRREHQSQFDSQFGAWREKRTSQRGSLNKVGEHMEVVGSDGQHIGTVDKVRGDRIILTKSDPEAGGHHHSIPCSWIESVDDKVTVNKTHDEAQRQWKDEERSAMFGESDDRDTPLTGSYSRSSSGNTY